MTNAQVLPNVIFARSLRVCECVCCCHCCSNEWHTELTRRWMQSYISHKRRWRRPKSFMFCISSHYFALFLQCTHAFILFSLHWDCTAFSFAVIYHFKHGIVCMHFSPFVVHKFPFCTTPPDRRIIVRAKFPFWHKITTQQNNAHSTQHTALSSTHQRQWEPRINLF